MVPKNRDAPTKLNLNNESKGAFIHWFTNHADELFSVC
jgi:hypothetical protein